MRQGSGVLLLHLPGELAEDHAHDAEQALLGGMAQHLAVRHLQADGMRRETRNVKPTCLLIFLIKTAMLFGHHYIKKPVPYLIPVDEAGVDHFPHALIRQQVPHLVFHHLHQKLHTQRRCSMRFAKTTLLLAIDIAGIQALAAIHV